MPDMTPTVDSDEELVALVVQASAGDELDHWRTEALKDALVRVSMPRYAASRIREEIDGRETAKIAVRQAEEELSEHLGMIKDARIMSVGFVNESPEGVESPHLIDADTEEEASAPGAPIESKGRPITRATDGSIIPAEPQLRPAKDRPVRLTIAQRAWAGDRRAETAEEITGGLGVSYVDLEGFDPDGNPVTLRTSAVAYVELFAHGKKSFYGPIVALSMLSPVNLVYVDAVTGEQLTAGSLAPIPEYAKVGWPTVLEDGQTRELTPEQERQLTETEWLERLPDDDLRNIIRSKHLVGSPLPALASVVLARRIETMPTDPVLMRGPAAAGEKIRSVTVGDIPGVTDQAGVDPVESAAAHYRQAEHVPVIVTEDAEGFRFTTAPHDPAEAAKWGWECKCGLLLGPLAETDTIPYHHDMHSTPLAKCSAVGVAVGYGSGAVAVDRPERCPHCQTSDAHPLSSGLGCSNPWHKLG